MGEAGRPRGRVPAGAAGSGMVTGSGTYAVEVACPLDRVRFPPMCACCGASPAGTLVVRKIFWRTYSGDSSHSDRHVFPDLPVPFCRECIRAHEAAKPEPDPRVLRALRDRWLRSTIPYWLPIGIILFMASRFAPTAVESLASGERAGVLMGGGILAFFAVSLTGFLRLVLEGRAQQIADYDGDASLACVDVARGPMGVTCYLPAPPTPTLASVNFTDVTRELVVGSRRTFTFTNPDVASAFALANAENVWDPRSSRAARARWVNGLVLAMVLALAIWATLRG